MSAPLEQPAPVAKMGEARERDDATLGLPTAFPSLGVTPRGVFSMTSRAPPRVPGFVLSRVVVGGKVFVWKPACGRQRRLLWADSLFCES